MYKPLNTLAVFALAVSQLYASEFHRIGGRPAALSNAFVSISDSWSTFHNQATLANLQKVSAGFFYESRFMIDELTLNAGTLTVPAGRGNFGFSFLQFGKGTFKEHKVGLAYSHRISPRLNAALQIDYLSRRFPENDNAYGFPTFELGMTYAISKELTLGAHVFNPLQNGFTHRISKQKVAAIYRLGGHYQFSQLVLLSGEIEKESDRKAIVKTGLEFSPLKKMALRFGFSGTPVRYSVGIGYSFGAINTDFAFSYHDYLGISPSVSIQFCLK